MNKVCKAAIHNLDKAVDLLDNISDAQLSDKSIPPYYSGVGSHIRHILDIFNCIFEGLDSGSIDLTNRKRDKRMHGNCGYAKIEVNRIQQKLRNLKANYFERSYKVTDDLGLGKVKCNYTLDGLLAQANSHTTHHYAIINYILDRLQIKIENQLFGYNPTSPQLKKLC